MNSATCLPEKHQNGHTQTNRSFITKTGAEISFRLLFRFDRKQTGLNRCNSKKDSQRRFNRLTQMAS
jgi:hypothetical protein